MTGAQFRKAALALDGASERAHMDHPDFRGPTGKIFATLSNGETRGMVKIPPEIQASIVGDASGAFSPSAGAWGRAGCTYVELKAAPLALVKELLAEALAFSQVARAPRRPAPASARKASAASPRRKKRS